MPNPETTDPYQCGWCRGAGKVPQMDDGPIDCPVCKGTGRKNALSRTTDQTDRNEWWIVFDTLREAQKRLESIANARHSWMDGAIAIAKERAGV